MRNRKRLPFRKRGAGAKRLRGSRLAHFGAAFVYATFESPQPPLAAAPLAPKGSLWGKGSEKPWAV